MVFNAACKDADLAHVQKHLAATCEIEPMFSRGLLALQGPQASQVLARLASQVASMKFMTGAFFVRLGGIRTAPAYPSVVARSRYARCAPDPTAGRGAWPFPLFGRPW